MSVHPGSEVCLMPCHLFLCLLALKFSLCMFPQAQLLWSAHSQINWTRSFEIPSCLPNPPAFRAFTSSSLYWERDKAIPWNDKSLVPLSGQLFSWRVPLLFKWAHLKLPSHWETGQRPEPTTPAQPLKTCRVFVRTSVPSAWLASPLVGCNNTSVFLWAAESPPTSVHEVQPQIKRPHYSLISDRSHMIQAWPIQASLFPDSSDSGTSTQSTITRLNSTALLWELMGKGELSPHCGYWDDRINCNCMLTLHLTKKPLWRKQR